jgi:hypothetical protein
MIRSVLLAAVLASAVGLPVAASAQPQSFGSESIGPQNAGPSGDVAGAFIAAARTRDHKAVLGLLSDDVLIVFPSHADRAIADHGQGQPFVIGYLDGLFGAKRGLTVDEVTPIGDTAHVLAHDPVSNDRYAIEVEVRNRRVVKVIVTPEASRAS